MNPRSWWRGVLVLLLVALLGVPPMYAQTPTPTTGPDPIDEILSRMSPQMKVGQLVLVSFPGTEVTADTEIVRLLSRYHIGGVLLKPENGNFGTPPLSPTHCLSLTSQLQWWAKKSVRSANLEPLNEDEEIRVAPYIPLFIAVTPDVAGIPVTTYISGGTTLPTPMALGAAWDLPQAEATGNVLGKELTALGINLYLGPNLDVLNTPRPHDPADLGTRSFGSDPFWVGKQGEAYIRGVHVGSRERVLTVPRHFPGLGSADRPLQEEVSTVQKSLEQLKQIELAPFFTVAAGTAGETSIADGFLVTHIQYRGFQGNIRVSTRPVSLDAQALKLILGLDEIAPWRESGGLLVSDNLGMKSVQRFYDPSGQHFNTRRVAQEALIAGNDLLILDHFSLRDEWANHFRNVEDTLDFLTTLYQSDPAFQDLVDRAVYRILKAKLRIYPHFASALSSTSAADFLEAANEAGNVSAQVATKSLTLIAPLSEDLLPSPPRGGDSLLIFTQEQPVQPNPDMPARPLLTSHAIKDAILRFYGPQGTGILSSRAVQSYTFAQLRAALESAATPPATDNGTATPTLNDTILYELQKADWIIFAPTGLNPTDPNALVLKDFLAQQVNFITARTVVLAFGPPYELDSTEISKLNLYYALYSPGIPFVETGVRAIFRDLLATGASPVDIPALNYDLAIQTMPDPHQVLSLKLVDAIGEALTPLQINDIRKGDTVNLQTDRILDKNGHPVPDGTPVEFVLSYPQEDIQQIETTVARNGIGKVSLVLEREGQLNITVHAAPEQTSVQLELTIRENQPPIVIASTPTLAPTPTPTITPTPTPTPPQLQSLPQAIHLPRPARFKLLLWGLGCPLFIGLLGFVWARNRELSATHSVRLSLWGFIGGLNGYLLLLIPCRWLHPSWYYRLSNKEFLVGGAAILLGLVTLGGAILFTHPKPKGG